MRGATRDTYATLRRKIILGEFGPGERLKEQSLAEELNVSRTPIRVAFRRLVEDGLVIAEPNRGVIVAAWTDRDNDEIFDLRILVESHASRLAARRRKEEHIAEMHALNLRTADLIEKKPEDFLTELQQINLRFHEVVLRAAASPRLSAFTQQLLGVERVIGAFFYYTDTELEDSLLDHQGITRAIARGEAELAGALVEAHIRRTWEKLRTQRQPQAEPAPEA
ncbi:GntR family transcriptional regulator [Cupriavidus sp. PET2-C1]